MKKVKKRKREQSHLRQQVAKSVQRVCISVDMHLLKFEIVIVWGSEAMIHVGPTKHQTLIPPSPPPPPEHERRHQSRHNKIYHTHTHGASVREGTSEEAPLACWRRRPPSTSPSPSPARPPAARPDWGEHLPPRASRVTQRFELKIIEIILYCTLKTIL